MWIKNTIVLEIAILRRLMKALFFTGMISVSLNMFAQEVDEIAQFKKALVERIPSFKIELVSKSPIDGVYEVLSSGQIYYISADAKYLMSGRLFSVENGIKDLTEAAMAQIDMKMAPLRREKLDMVAEEDMVIFKAADEKYKITVFTDVDCAYCRKLHQDMPAYNAQGITVRYMGFPRAGLGSPSHQKLRSVWCAKDQLEAMNKAKLERTFGDDVCDDPIDNHLSLVREFGLTGTPAIILKSGRYLPGYADAEKLLQIIKEDEKLLADSDKTAE